MERLATAFLEHWPTIITFLFGGAIFVAMIKRDVRDLAVDVRELRDETKKITQILVAQATHAQRLDSLDVAIGDLRSDIRELRRGEGLIVHRSG